MPYTLNVEFSGLCAFIYNNKTKRMCVVLNNGRFPHLDSNGEPMHEHIAVLRVESYNWQSDVGAPPDFEYDGKRFLFFEFEDVKLQKQGGGNFDKPFYVNDGDCGSQPNDTNSEYFCWVPQTRNIVGKSYKVSAECLSKPPDRRRVVARFLMTEGTVSTAHLLQDKEGTPIIYRFGPQHVEEPQTQVVASTVRWQISDLLTPVEMVLTTFGSKKERKVVIGPQEDSTEVTVEIENIPWQEIFEDHRHELNPEHFKSAYNLAFPSLRGTTMPIPVTNGVVKREFSSAATKKGTTDDPAPEFFGRRVNCHGLVRFPDDDRV